MLRMSEHEQEWRREIFQDHVYTNLVIAENSIEHQQLYKQTKSFIDILQSFLLCSPHTDSFVPSLWQDAPYCVRQSTSEMNRSA